MEHKNNKALVVKLVANSLTQRFQQSPEVVEDVAVTLAGAEDVGAAKVAKPEAMASSSTVKCAKMGQARLGKAGARGTAITRQPHVVEVIGGLVGKHIFALTDRPVRGVTG